MRRLVGTFVGKIDGVVLCDCRPHFDYIVCANIFGRGWSSVKSKDLSPDPKRIRRGTGRSWTAHRHTSIDFETVIEQLLESIDNYTVCPAPRS